MSTDKILSEINSNLNINISELPPADKNFHHYSYDKATKKPIWIIGFEFIHLKNTFFVYCYGNFKTGDEFISKSWESDNQSSSFRKKFNEEMSTIKYLSDVEKQKRHEECKEKSSNIFNSLSKVSETIHPYLESKVLSSNFTARINNRGSLNIPVFNFDDNNNICIVGLQYIFMNEKSKYEKRFTSGIRLKGSFFMLSYFDIKAVEHIYLGEGFATCATIATAHPEAHVLGCITASNTTWVIHYIKALNPAIKITLCCDNDHETKKKTNKNPGIDAAFKAKKNNTNVILKIPEPMPECSDWNDILQVKGLDYVREKTKSEKKDFINIEILGHENNEKFFFFIEQTLSVVSLSVSQMTPNSFISMAISEYWGGLYGFKQDKEGNLTSTPNWPNVVDEVCNQARDKGNFSWEKVRGFGIWHDNGRIVQHLGKHLLVDGQVTNISRFDSEFKYQSFAEVKLIENVKAPIELIQACRTIRFTHPGHFAILFGWIITSNIFGLFSWRPHIWINAPFGSGKSTILAWISRAIFNCLPLTDSTSAGIRQTLKTDQRAVVFDESEPDGEQSKNRMAGLLDLARHCSSPNTMEVVRGTPGGNSQRQNVNTVFCFASIINSLVNKSDLSRYFQLSLKSLEGQTPEEYDSMCEVWNKVDALKIYSWATGNHHKIIERSKLAHKAIRAVGIDSRTADQYHAVVGAFSFVSGMDVEEVIELIELKRPNVSDEESEADVMWQKIMGAIYDTHDKDTIGNLMMRAMNEISNEETLNGKHLRTYGIKIIQKNKIAIQVNNENLMSIIKYRFYANVLRSGTSKHFDITDKSKGEWFGSYSAKCVILQLK